MNPGIPYTIWQPLSVADVRDLFADAPFSWGIAGGYAVELFLGTSFRDHGDIDVVIFRDDQLAVQQWLADWRLYAADPPGTLRPWLAGEFLPVGIQDIFGHRRQANAWELQLMLIEVEGNLWVFRRDARIRGRRDVLLTSYGGIPCLRVEVQLLYKAHSKRPKDTRDLEACLPHLSADAKRWLRTNLLVLYGADHPWLDELT